MEIVILIISQLVFSFMRNLNVRYTSRDKVVMSLITSMAVKIAWLFILYIGVKSMIDRDYITIIVFIVSGVCGDFLSFKIKIKDEL